MARCGIDCSRRLIVQVCCSHCSSRRLRERRSSFASNTTLQVPPTRSRSPWRASVVLVRRSRHAAGAERVSPERCEPGDARCDLFGGPALLTTQRRSSKAWPPRWTTSTFGSTPRVPAVRARAMDRADLADDSQLSRWAGTRAVPDAARSLAWLADRRTLPDGRDVNGMLIGDHDQYGDEAANRREPDPSLWRMGAIPW